MKKILLVDTNCSSKPIYDYLVRSGNEVFVCGGNPNDFLAKYAKNYVELDYSNIDRSLALVDSLGVDYIVPGCNDLSYKICTELNSQGKFYGLDRNEVSEIINNKKKFRLLAAEIGLPVPRIIPHGEFSDILPVIVKPTDAYSGRGVTIVRESDRDKLQTAIEYAESFSRTKTCVIEEYIEGQLYSHSAFLSGGKIVCEFIVEEHGTANPFVVDTSRVVYDFPEDVIGRIGDTMLTMAKHLQLVDGLIHTQFIKQGSSFWLIEVTRRCPGDLYSQLIEFSTGFRYAEAYTEPFLNQTVSLKDVHLKQSYVMRHTISQQVAKTFSSLQFNLPIQIEDLLFLSLSGDMVKSSPFGRIALLFARANSESELSKLFRSTLQRELYNIY
ncbi:ATP-grasp domain-containing protein [Chamaesiphon polymorphus]|uniref:ATP-grasp domain-containing protein n=1 Tax=Chamaesiphon polymorphus CCALA 037 TaxID=2107692 RepID=A0A2T1GCN2_9CYAN|nr:ATP-grasp domain-containing protein [Chamaesiphon polymorphus]PSB55168.1 hypothetical protein C7B77_15885 [Chamaesiphon polymorphus CCALA 037]